MTSTAMTMDSPEQLQFAQSESKPVGMGGGAMQWLRDNAPRVVAGLKLAGDITIGFSMNPFLLGYTAFAGVGRIITLVYGTKENQRQVAGEATAESLKEAADDSWLGSAKKVLHPRQYPVESSAGLSVIGESFIAAYGASQFFDGKTGFTPLILGLAGLWSYANIVFGKEENAKDKQADDSLTFAESESKPVGLWGRVQQMMKENPVLVSSLMQMGIVCGYLVGAMMEGLSTAIIASCGFAMTAIVVQALFVRKNEFNIEGAEAGQQAQNPAQSPQAPQASGGLRAPDEVLSFLERYLHHRGGNEPGVQPA